MTEPDIKKFALLFYEIDGRPFSELQENEFMEVMRFYFKNRQLIRDAQFLLRNGLSYFREGYPERCDVVLRSGIIPDGFDMEPGPPAGNAKPYNKRKGKVYFMRNDRNGFTKIGFSFNPKFREKTLQSEEPEVRMIGWIDGTPDDEKSLHKRFDSQRQRGEWFNLSEQDIQELIGGF